MLRCPVLLKLFVQHRSPRPLKQSSVGMIQPSPEERAAERSGSPVLRGEDDRDTFSCQLYFLANELLFSVSCQSDMETERWRDEREEIRNVDGGM